MHSLNILWFNAMAAGLDPGATWLPLARLVARWSWVLCVAAISVALWRRPQQWRWLAALITAALSASLFSRELAGLFGAPRPFQTGLSLDHLGHGARPGFPSTHASVMFAVAFTALLVLPRGLTWRVCGLFLLAVALATGWARVYVGVHFPFDVLGGALLGALISLAVWCVTVLLHHRRRVV